MWTNQGNYKYIKALPGITQSYNRTTHSSLGVAPSDVNEQNQYDVWRFLYRDLLEKKKRKHKPKFVLGEKVRLALIKQTFSKGYSPRISEEVFLIAKVLPTDPVTYYIKDLKGEEVKGNAHALLN